MSAQADKAIADILTTYGETFAASVWRVQGTAVIYHKSLERIAAKARIVFDAPVVIRSERDEAVMIVTGRMPGPERELVEWSVGEAAIGQNYRVSGKQAAYPWSMAEKRGKDRVILKLIGLSGVLYSEDEADDFRPTQETREQPKREAAQGHRQSEQQADEVVRPMSVEHMLAELTACQETSEIEALQQEPAFRLGYKQASKADQQRILAERQEVRRRVDVGGAA